MSMHKKLNVLIKKVIRRSLFTEEELKDLKKPMTYKVLRDINGIVSLLKILKETIMHPLGKKECTIYWKAWMAERCEKGIDIEQNFKAQLGYELNFKEPKTYNEKIMWLKLYYQNPLITKCCDKFAMKEYVSDVIGSEYVVPVIDSWTNADHIDFTKLPEKFVIKVNWSSGYLKIVKNREELNSEDLKKQLKKMDETV